MKKRSTQSGAFLMARALLVVGILMAMLIIPVYLKKEREDRELAVHQTETAMSQDSATQPATAAGTATAASGTRADGASTAPRPLGHGLTFVPASDVTDPPDVARLNCHGEPVPLDQPHQGSCNPYQGDTSCSTVLPVLCVRPTGTPLPSGLAAGAYPGWTGATLGATQPVMGAVLESADMASARCEKELGTGWRMAEFHDGPGGWGFQGLRGAGLTGYTRYWVHINDQKGNCWDSGG